MMVDIIDDHSQKPIGEQVKVRILDIRRDFTQTKVKMVKIQPLEGGEEERQVWVKPEFLHPIIEASP